MSTTIIAIGDELLAGFVLDTNSRWMAQRLRALGHPLKRISVVSDRPPEIVDQVRRDLADPDVDRIFTDGGLGPTPDDRTFEAMGLALGRELVIWPEVRDRIEDRVRRMHAAGLLESPEPTEASLRMARIPARPGHVFHNRKGLAPGVAYEENGTQLFVLPGVPMEMRTIFTEELEPRYLAGGRPVAVREVRFRYAIEQLFYPLMRELEERYPDVAVGSYPSFETKELTLRSTGADEKRVEEVARLIRTRATQLGFA